MSEADESNKLGALILLSAFTFVASALTFALCWVCLDYSGRGPVLGQPPAVLGAYSLAFVGSLSVALQSLIISFFAPELSWIEGLFWGSIGRILAGLPALFIDSKRFSTSAFDETKPLLKKEDTAASDRLQRYGMLALRGLMGTFPPVTLNWGVQFLLPSEAAALWSTAPLFAILWSYIILGETMSLPTILIIIVSFIGILLVIQPVEMVSWLWIGGFDTPSLAHSGGCLLVLAGGICQGILGPMMQALKWTVFEVVLWTGGMGALSALLLATATHPLGMEACWSWATATGAGAVGGGGGGVLAAVLWISALGAASAMCVYFVNWAWQLEPAGAVDSVFVSVCVVVVLAFQVIIFKEMSNTVALIGVLVIVLAGILLVYARLRARVTTNDPPDDCETLFKDTKA